MKQLLRPYLFLSACGILAFAPVSFMLRALKNDIIALEYPINQFISQCIRNGEIPYWFNTWSMGFPLQSNLSWGIYSTPQMVFSSVFDYNIYTLHFEFMFFLLLSGWSMFYLLKKYFVKDEMTAVLLATCYMLSGFMVGSTQWLLYITAAAFTPLLVASVLSLLERPSAKKAFQLAICYTLMFTSVYAAFNIIATYGILALIIAWIWKHREKGLENRQRFKYLFLTLLFTVLLCGPCLYFTIELLGEIDRGDSLVADSSFFNSNYLHPGALSSLLFPFSSVKMGYTNTEGTMLNSYTGLFILLTLPAAIALAIKSRNKTAWVLLAASLLCLLIAFGDYTPLRKLLNVLPGFSYFRNPALFRFYFIFLLVLFMARAVKNKKAADLLQEKSTRYSILLGGILCLAALIISAGGIKDISFSSLASQLKDSTYSTTLFTSAVVQGLLLLLLWWLIKKKKFRWAPLLVAGDMVLNTLLCTPFFSVSSYTPAEVNAFLKSEKGFPVQTEAPATVPTIFKDPKGNSWQNSQVFVKKVSAQESYSGPLILKGSGTAASIDSTLSLLHIKGDPSNSSVKIVVQKPGHIQAQVYAASPSTLTLLQNYYPGWSASVNGKGTRLTEKGRPGLSVNVPAGDSRVDFNYERKEVWFSALGVHLAVLLFGLLKLMELIRRFRSSSPSLPY